jgi:hypothetical protein
MFLGSSDMATMTRAQRVADIVMQLLEGATAVTRARYRQQWINVLLR